MYKDRYLTYSDKAIEIESNSIRVADGATHAIHSPHCSYTVCSV
jgi:hypothetical protein